ncbi:MAG TPA: DUF2752 domain-containing protein [Tepidisphaeraceae bacterium]|nr:DUF2752 domain-containing protein [Tepidisphaeraceae bacterium]
MTEGVQSTVPRIYAVSPVPQRLSPAHRLIALIVSMACLAMLITAVIISPDRSGTSSHVQLGLSECHFLRTSNLPCPSCGMTTSFAWFVRGNLLASLYIQPMGTFLATAATITFWAALYIAATGKPVHRLLAGLPSSYYVLVPVGIGIAAWGWKIFIHLRGMDGWG